MSIVLGYFVASIVFGAVYCLFGYLSWSRRYAPAALRECGSVERRARQPGVAPVMRRSPSPVHAVTYA